MRPAPEAAAALCVSGPDFSASLEETKEENFHSKYEADFIIYNGGHQSPFFPTENVLQ